MFAVYGLVVTLVSCAWPSIAAGSPCPLGSIPFMKCDFSLYASGPNSCWAGVNTGQAADPINGVCQVPSPQNGCLLHPKPDKSWQWESSSVTCCNCFQTKPYPNSLYCQGDSLPEQACDFRSTYGSRACYPAVNTAQTARPMNNECQVPTPENGCRLEVNPVTLAWSWRSSNFGVQCCNCFLKRNHDGPHPGLPQTSASVSMMQGAVEQPKRAGDEASMLQVARASSQESHAQWPRRRRAASPSPCMAGSIPYMECDFNLQASGPNACWAGVNTGQAANPYNGVCQVPSPQNGCLLKPSSSTPSWQWESPSVTCCNCFQTKSFPNSQHCQADSLPEQSCDFRSTYGSHACYPAVNTGQTARPKYNECQVPTPENGCRLEVNPATLAWSWRSRNHGVSCCNCFRKRDAGNSLAQIDEASMIQLPAGSSKLEL